MQLPSVCVLHTILTFSMVQHVILLLTQALQLNFTWRLALKIIRDQVLKGAALEWENNLLQCKRPAGELCCSPGSTQLWYTVCCCHWSKHTVIIFKMCIFCFPSTLFFWQCYCLNFETMSFVLCCKFLIWNMSIINSLVLNPTGYTSWNSKGNKMTWGWLVQEHMQMPSSYSDTAEGQNNIIQCQF